ncbi:MAG TPA: DUF4383 domain-containing protein [Patescibacteria group bacterium]|jgi:hypothetical protein|nr:DUF4383 domain-containing protein [Patescibacteria group bacterium]
MTKTIMYVAGVVFIVLGLLGFINDPILGIFDVNALHNIINLAAGVLALIFASKGESQARTFALVLGVIFALLTILGFMTGNGNMLGLIANNMADTVLHLVLAVIFLFLGLKKSAPSGYSGGMSTGM